MSIVAAAAAAPNDVPADAVLAAVCLAFAVPVVVRLVRRSPLNLPERLPPGGSAWPLVMAMAWGLLLWLVVPVTYVTWRGLAPSAGPATAASPVAGQAGAGSPATAPARPPSVEPVPRPATPPGRTPDLANLPPADVAFLATVPHLSVFLALLLLDNLFYHGDLTRLGFSLRQARGGLAGGAVLSLAFVPLVFGGAVVTDWVYRQLHYTHPREHDLLRVLAHSPRLVRLAIGVGATVVAPLAEELLFRGHVQTLLRRLLAQGVAPAGGAFDPAAPPVPPAWATWGAIVLASVAFAIVHERWTWPPIFLLSLCLGWAYERTGNLWPSVAIHAAFNAVSTLIFLLTGGGAG